MRNPAWHAHRSPPSITARLQARWSAILNYVRRKVKIIALLNSYETQIKTMHVKLALIAWPKTMYEFDS